MRAERLLKLAQLLRADYSATKIQQHLEALSAALENAINSPNAETAAAVSVARARVNDALKSSSFNDVSPTTHIDLDELRMWEWTASRLAAQIDDAFLNNGVSLSDAKSEIDSIIETVKKDVNAANSINSSLTHFQIEPEELESGTFEIGILIPRDAIHNEVRRLGRELVDLNQMFSVFSEIYGDGREDFKLISISTSDPTVFMESPAAVAAAVVVAIERIVALYNQILTIRKAHQELEKNKISNKILSELKSEIDQKIKDGIASHVADIKKNGFSNIDSGRKNELSKELDTVMWAMAKRIDAGYVFDVRGRVDDPAEPAEGEEVSQRLSDETKSALKHLREVERANREIQKFRAEAVSVLQLPDKSEDSATD